jgi:hypothetical protein
MTRKVADKSTYLPYDGLSYVSQGISCKMNMFAIEEHVEHTNQYTLMQSHGL